MSSNGPVPPIVYNSVSAYTVQVWELLSQFDEEVRWIWSLPKRTSVKWLFLSIRYGGLALQGAIVYQTIHLKYHDYSSSACQSWFILRLLTPSTIGALAQLTLVIRICALYNREIRIKRCVMLLYIVQVITCFVIWIVLLHVPISYSPRCQGQSHMGKWPYLTVGFSSMAVDCVLVVLTFFKVIRLSRISNAPSILRVIVRDGTWAFMLITIVTIITQSFVFSDNWMLQSGSLDWLVTSFSFTGTRLILNMLQFKDHSVGRQAAIGEQWTSSERGEYLTNDVPIGLSILTQNREGNLTQLVQPTDDAKKSNLVL